MFFRFTAALVLVVLISILGIHIEHETLRLRRAVSRQYYHTDLLLELHAQLRLTTQRLTAPVRNGSSASDPSLLAGSSPRNAGPPRRQQDQDNASERPPQPGLPLLRFRQPFRPQGID